MRPRIKITIAPGPGTFVFLDWQEYRFLGSSPYAKVDGTTILLAEWETKCPECNQPFTTVSIVPKLPGNRRCPEHRNPGRNVRTYRNPMN